MQGPVGFRCKECGKPRHDPLTSFTPTQVLLGGLMAIAGGAVVAFIGAQLGFFTIIVAFFGGGLIADVVMRFTGYKRGPMMIALLLGGIALGTLLGAAGDFWLANQQLTQAMVDAAAAAGVDPSELQLTFADWLQIEGAWLLIAAGAAMAGAWGRLRF
jgi:ABC-type enterobactin transport system permease subunit